MDDYTTMTMGEFIGRLEGYGLIVEDYDKVTVRLASYFDADLPTPLYYPDLAVQADEQKEREEA